MSIWFVKPFCCHFWIALTRDYLIYSSGFGRFNIKFNINGLVCNIIGSGFLG
uniref:Uncharacterized protein n=1 Tax=Meloidogyne enterolobii TaxID=390850 RepID=A0A6V7XPE4_MELEN|nr:unnamed protein product [Meloidogyne enterolobii]